ncbi:MAG: FtsH protease activity modulator HflK [Roseitalea sp.]|jgi:membrane protease subunit HflK|uniref:Protein HflK n=1 Tax=Oceaniradius stylonematis TaxID=2184161 RepID=A0A3A8A643_9HYPH|nr:FtsH protease activity modulator HflK [Oceaniradius stylonematis]MBO6551458.1 FtsH protease activity modulator HflK [Roseitalea sp.]MBO6952162.1 FtsH protease activity modulator HflK [Rhizobiaceae bacterium]RNC96030.1 MAG: FtsH protease activity modulator HflK [Oricola sp.]MBO6591992.1 FtsH protease activity modulator HflK [Roseitalea sp.]MBO6598247.1 FtsH protease activity modulator HflK [Roseitalea sp.]
MPWSNQNGGGGPWGGGGDKNGGPWGGGGGNGGGPWGQGPRGPNRPGGGGQPPDLEDIIRQGQDRLKRALPGGGGGGGRALIGLLVVGALVLYGLQAFYQVDTDERAVELLFGKPKAELSAPGLHFHFWPVETVEKVQIVEKQIQVGSGTGRGGSNGLMLSGDQNIVDVQFSVLYSVIDPRSYLFNVAGPDDAVRQVAESAMREIVGRRPAQDVFRDNRAAIADEVRTSMQATLDSYGAGIQINTVSIEDAAPPREVADAFEEVQRAEQDEDRFREEANQYSNQQLGQARGEAAQIREDAAAYATQVVQEAEGEAQRFISIYDQYRLAPDVTRKRLFLETMEGVLGNSNKVILDEEGGGSGVVPYLPLPEIQNRRQTTAQDGVNQ